MPPRVVALSFILGSIALVGCASPGPLVSAAGEGNRDQVGKLIDQGADVNMHDAGAGGCDTPLMYSALKAQDEMVGLLLKRGAVIEKTQGKGGPLTCALLGATYWTRPRTLKIALLLLDAGAKPDPMFMTFFKYRRAALGDEGAALIERAITAQSRPVVVPVAASGSETPPPEPPPNAAPAAPAEKPWWAKGDMK